jgi:hypothetical protein
LKPVRANVKGQVMAEVVKHLPSKNESPSSYSSTTKTKTMSDYLDVELWGGRVLVTEICALVKRELRRFPSTM